MVILKGLGVLQYSKTALMARLLTCVGWVDAVPTQLSRIDVDLRKGATQAMD